MDMLQLQASHNSVEDESYVISFKGALTVIAKHGRGEGVNARDRKSRVSGLDGFRAGTTGKNQPV
jgi:hypothetical protein